VQHSTAQSFSYTSNLRDKRRRIFHLHASPSSGRHCNPQRRKMGRPRRDIRAAVEACATPPLELPAGQAIARVVRAEGSNLYRCTLPRQGGGGGGSQTQQAQCRDVLVELADRFRNTIWIRRGGYVAVDLADPRDVKGRVEGEIVNVVREEKIWRKQSYWHVFNPGSSLSFLFL
jgi:probable RNA-binding protein EIF1AD